MLNRIAVVEETKGMWMAKPGLLSNGYKNIWSSLCQMVRLLLLVL
jgi:hypothetical protein